MKINKYITFPLGLFFISIFAGIALLLRYYESGIIAYTVSIILGMIILFVFAHTTNKFFIYIAIIGVFTACLSINTFSTYLDLKEKKIIRDISPEDVVKYPDAAGFTFKNAVLRMDLKGRSYFKLKSYSVVPIMNKDNNKNPVFVWAIYNDIEPKDKETITKMYIKRKGLLLSYKDAVKMAKKKHKLVSHKNAVFVDFIQSMDIALKSSKLEIVYGILLMFFFWLLIDGFLISNFLWMALSFLIGLTIKKERK